MRLDQAWLDDAGRCCFLYSVPQSDSASSTGLSERPVLVSEYSTRGGTSGYTLRFTSPSSSIERNDAVSIFWLTLPMERFSSLKRIVPFIKSRKIRIFHFEPIKNNVVSTGHGLYFSFMPIPSFCFILSVSFFLSGFLRLLFRVFCLHFLLPKGQPMSCSLHLR